MVSALVGPGAGDGLPECAGALAGAGLLVVLPVGRGLGVWVCGGRLLGCGFRVDGRVEVGCAGG